MGTKDKAHCESKLASLAGEDSPERPDGLWSLTSSVRDWANNDALRSIRKFRSGRHRFYITGRHQDCNYTICHTMANKRDEDDTPSEKPFKEMILRALASPPSRVIALPDAENKTLSKTD